VYFVDKKQLFFFIGLPIFSVFLLLGSTSYYHFFQKGRKPPLEEIEFLPQFSSSSPSKTSTVSVEEKWKSSTSFPPKEKILDLQELEKYIEQLGHEDYGVREQAYGKIRGMGKALLPHLEKFKNKRDLHIQETLEEIKSELESD
jgi:hypothetical protein